MLRQKTKHERVDLVSQFFIGLKWFDIILGPTRFFSLYINNG